MRQEPHKVLLSTSGEIHSVALDKGKPARKPLGTGKEKRAAMDLNYLADNDYMPVLQKVKDKLSEYYGNMV